MKKRLLSCLMLTVLLASCWTSTAFASDAWEVKGVDYDDIENLVDGCIDFSASGTVGSAVDQLESAAGTLSKYEATLNAQLGTLTPGTDSYQTTAGQLALVQAGEASLGAAVSSIESSMGMKDSPRDSTIIAARTLYITFNSLRDQYSDLYRKQTVYNANLSNYQQQHDSGYISDLQMAQIEAQGDSIQANMGTLQTQLDAVKRSFNTLLGRNYNYGLDMHSLPFGRLDSISKIKYNSDVISAVANYSGDISGAGFNNPDYDPDKGSFAASFRKLYDTMENKNDLLSVEQKNLAVQQKSFDASQKQYDAGMISKLTYINAQDSLDTETSKVKAAKTALFTAYEQYQWAIEYGIINSGN